MIVGLLSKGFLIGFSIAMPVGPIGLVCMRNSLNYGLVCGLISGLGAACADAICSGLAGLGIVAIGDWLMSYSTWLQIFGALFLFYIGLATFFSKSNKENAAKSTHRLPRAFFTTFVLTLTNPLTILGFAGLYAGFGIGMGNTGPRAAWITTFGVFFGSAAWWVILSLISSRFRDRMNEKISRWFNRISGLVLFGFGIGALVVGFITKP